MMVQEKAMNMSNEQAVQILIPMRNMMCDQHGCPISDAVFALDKAIEALSIGRRQGEWIVRKYDWIDGSLGTRYFRIRCSVCNYSTYDDETTNFCPNCGSQMLKGAVDETD